MPIAKVITDFSQNRHTDDGVSRKASTIELALTDNPRFPTLVSEVQAIKSTNENFISLLNRMEDGNKQTTLEKNMARKDLEAILSSVGLKVQNICLGDELAILSAGYDVRKKASPVGILPAPENFKVVAGAAKGSLYATWNVVLNAYIYELEYTLTPVTPTSVWSRISTTKHYATTNNLSRGLAYALRVTAAGAHPDRLWSDEIISYVM